MLWILQITVIGFLLGDPALQFDGVYQEKFKTEEACKEFIHSTEVIKEIPRLKNTARRHLNDRFADVSVTFECVMDAGEPA